MRNFLILACFFTCLTSFGQKQIPVTIEWQFRNLVEGYEHDNKLLVYLDGNLLGESSVKNEVETNSMDFTVPKGKHTIKIVSYSLYEGNWEIRSVENEYSTNGTIERQHKFKKKTKIFLIFDMDKTEPVVDIRSL
ncbi:MAG: hypothetical protein K0R65_1549 [Crocinitomicaceae bacterium]|jgi:hypothetical protein|nr:hypothetical protein [Crocinitomicaceae bacterium]